MDRVKVNEYLDQINYLTALIREEMREPDGTMIDEGDDLQAALDVGGSIVLRNNVQVFSDGYDFSKNGTSITGLGSNLIQGGHRAALNFPQMYQRAVVENVQLDVTASEVAVRVGSNDRLATDPAKVPSDITFRKVIVRDHTGKRAFEVNGQRVLFEDCIIYGIYDPENQDSQAIWIGNSPGDIQIRNCQLEAASENILVGGDAMKLLNTRPTNILIEGCELTKPIEWKGKITSVKNLLELKDGHNVLIRNCKLWNCWKAAQDGYAFMFTPTRGGSLQQVVVENCEVLDVGGIVNITGRDHNIDEPFPRTQVEFNLGHYQTNKAVMGGSGRFCLITEGPEYLKLNKLYVRHEGSAFVDIADKKQVDQLHILGCDFNYGTYGLRIGGLNHGDNSLGIVADLRIEGNTISGAHNSFKLRYPNNIYV